MPAGQKVGGRRKGTKNRKTLAREDDAANAKAHLDADMKTFLAERYFDGDAHTLFQAVYKDRSQAMIFRLDAAKAAIPYEKPKLVAIEHSGSMTHKHVKELSLAELDQRIAGMLAGETSAPVSAEDAPELH